MSIPTRAEVKLERHLDELAEDAANAAEHQAWLWHRKRHGEVWAYGRQWMTSCATYEAVKSALVAAVAGMSVDQQLDYLVNGRTRKRL